MLKKLFGVTIYLLLSGVCFWGAIGVFNLTLPWMLNVGLPVFFIGFGIAFLYAIYLEVTE